MGFLDKLEITANVGDFVRRFLEKASHKKFVSNVYERSGECNVSKEMFAEEVEDFLKRFKSEAAFVGSKLKIWRVLYLKDIEDFDLNSIGACWTWRKKSIQSLAESLDYGKPKSEQFVISAAVEAKAIDFAYSLIMNIWLPEDEINPKHGAAILVTGIESVWDKSVKKKFNPPIRVLVRDS